MENKLAPIILFVYNRPWHTRQTLDALMLNHLANQSTLYIYCDGPKADASAETLKNIQEVRTVIREKKWCNEVAIIERTENLGLANSVIKGVTEVIDKYGKVIVLEDDIKTIPFFLTYMNKALNLYQERQEVFHINGFNNESNLQFFLRDFYFLKFMSCWGWATWKDRWAKLELKYEDFYVNLMKDSNNLIEFNYENTLDFHLQLKDNIKGKIKTWAILWYSTVFFNKGLCLTPKFSLVENIGMDGTGEHCGKSSFHTKIFSPKKSFSTKNLEKIKRYKEFFISRFHLKMFYRYGKKFRVSKFLKSELKFFMKV